MGLPSMKTQRTVSKGISPFSLNSLCNVSITLQSNPLNILSFGLVDPGAGLFLGNGVFVSYDVNIMLT